MIAHVLGTNNFLAEQLILATWCDNIQRHCITEHGVRFARNLLSVFADKTDESAQIHLPKKERQFVGRGERQDGIGQA